MTEADRAGSVGVSPARDEGRGWYTRDHLPHFDRPGLVQMITIRLHDSLPSDAVPAVRRSKLTDSGERRRIERLLDSGAGSAVLRDGRVAAVVEQALHHFDEERYRLLAWVIMPNHVHVLVETKRGHSLSAVVQAWKSFSAKEANRVLGKSGAFWQPGYYDRAIRDARHLVSAVDYIHRNPVKAGLVAYAQDWRYCSARLDDLVFRAGETPALPARQFSL